MNGPQPVFHAASEQDVPRSSTRGRVSARIGVALAAALLLLQAAPGWLCALTICATQPDCCWAMAHDSAPGVGAGVCPTPDACGVSGSSPVAKSGGSFAEIRDLSFAPKLVSGPAQAGLIQQWIAHETALVQLARQAWRIRPPPAIPVYLRYLRLTL